MFEVMLWTTIAIAILGMVIAFDGTRDIFHPLMYIGPMMIFLYGYMPLKIYQSGQLSMFFDDGQLVFIQTLNLLGVLAFVAGCLGAGLREPAGNTPKADFAYSERRLLFGGAIAGGIGLVAWMVAIINVGGFVSAFSRSYGGGWDSSGYVRDAVMLLLVGVLLVQAAIAVGRPRLSSLFLLGLFGTPWLVEALLTGRRGPTFAFVVMAGASWYLYRNRRPPVILATVCGLALGYFVMFLVVNRNNIHLGSEMEFETDVTPISETLNTGNEFVYGGGAVLSSQKKGTWYWGKRYLAQLVVRPIPSAIWPTKYADFGVPELLKNAGTGEGFGDTLGWDGATGSAPGIIADLWLEFWWFGIPVFGLLGWGYGRLWRQAAFCGGPWLSQYVIVFALSIYLVMQTMEAVIFRSLVLSIPVWLTWNWARVRRPKTIRRQTRVHLPAARTA